MCARYTDDSKKFYWREKPQSGKRVTLPVEKKTESISVEYSAPKWSSPYQPSAIQNTAWDSVTRMGFELGARGYIQQKMEEERLKLKLVKRVCPYCFYPNFFYARSADEMRDCMVCHRALRDLTPLEEAKRDMESVLHGNNIDS